MKMDFEQRARMTQLEELNVEELAALVVELEARHAAPVEGVERVTDDRPAETIPDEEMLFISNTMSSIAQGSTGASERERRLAERIANKYRAAYAENVRAETRIEVLEAALRDAWNGLGVTLAWDTGLVIKEDWPSVISLVVKAAESVRAALAAPSGVKP